MKKSLEKHLNPPKDESVKEFKNKITEDLVQIKNDIDFLYSLVQPEPIDLISLDNYDYGVTIQLTEEMYVQILEYIENKNHLFIGIS